MITKYTKWTLTKWKTRIKCIFLSEMRLLGMKAQCLGSKICSAEEPPSSQKGFPLSPTPMVWRCFTNTSCLEDTERFEVTKQSITTCFAYGKYILNNSVSLFHCTYWLKLIFLIKPMYLNMKRIYSKLMHSLFWATQKEPYKMAVIFLISTETFTPLVNDNVCQIRMLSQQECLH